MIHLDQFIVRGGLQNEMHLERMIRQSNKVMKEYGFIKNKEEMLQVVAKERAESGEMSRLEKTYIDKLLGAKDSLFVD